MDLSVIIVNYNVKYFLEQCLYAVVKSCTNLDAEIFVVDNNSSDNSEAYLEKKFPGVKFKWNKTNPGFAKANNSVLAETKGEHILFLNPDTIIPEDCLEKCLSFFEKQKDCGALSVRMIDGSGKYLKESKRSFPTPSASFFKMSGLSALFPESRIFAKYYAGNLEEMKINEVDVLPGAFMMCSSIVLKKVKGFDEDFFMYGEDIDLSYRMQKEGFKNFYFPETSIIHYKGESTQKRSPGYIKHFYSAMLLFVSKHYKEKKATAILMNISVRLGKLAALLFLKIKAITSLHRKKIKQTHIAIIADQQRFSEVIQILKHAERPFIITGRIAVDPEDNDTTIGKMEELELLIESSKIDQLLFCENGFLYKEIIKCFAEYNGKVSYLIRSNGSDSIVGSNNKNSRGVFIAKG